MIFIFGSPRSGTTLLAQSLNAHSDIVIPHESDFIIPVAHIFDRIKEPDIGRDMIVRLLLNSEYFKQGWSLNGYISETEIRETIYSCKYSLSDILDSLYAKVAANAQKKVAGDKSPNDLLGLRILFKNEAFSEECRIIHIVRDIRDVMVSLNGLGWVSDLDLYFPRFWCDTNLYLYSVLYSNKKKYLFIRYEDLVSEPEEGFSKICDFLKLPFQTGMLSPDNRHPRYKDMSNHQNLFQPISSNKVELYKTKLKKTELENIQIQAGEAIGRFGYGA